jgi:hypothetical protein
VAARIANFLCGILPCPPEGADRRGDGCVDIGDAVTAVKRD